MLRTRLMLGLLCLLAILGSMGLYSINSCSSLGKRVEVVLRDSDRAGRNIEAMKRSGATMTGALLVLVAGNQKESRNDFTSASQDFENALTAEQDRTTASADEKKAIATLAKAYADYKNDAVTFLNQADHSSSWHGDAIQLGKQTATLLGLVDQLTLAHQTSVTTQSGATAEDVNDTIKSLTFLMMLAVISTIFAYFGLSHGLLNPLRALTASIREIGQGNLDQTVKILSRDELGTLATSFNDMAVQLREYRATASVELLRLNTTIRATLASFPDPIFVLNAEGAVEFRNPAGDQLALKLLFSGVTRLPQKVDEKVEQVRASGVDYLPTIFEDAIKFHLNGQDRYFLPRIVILRDEDGASFGVAVILEDVTRILLLDDVKSNLIATVSHELKTPLTSVRMALYLLVEKTVGPLNEKQLDLVATAREDADRLLRTLNDLLDLAKLEQGPSQLDLTPISPAELVEMAVHDCRDIVHEAGNQITIEVAPNLPKVEIDRQRLAYVFSNFITNAIKYSPSGTTLKVAAHMGRNRAEKEMIRFSVLDQGPGISPEHQEHIFERFYRIAGSNKSGAGLGLSIAREIVEAHGGEIGVISRPGEGSEFFFVLFPAASEDNDISQPAQSKNRNLL